MRSSMEAEEKLELIGYSPEGDSWSSRQVKPFAVRYALQTRVLY